MTSVSAGLVPIVFEPSGDEELDSSTTVESSVGFALDGVDEPVDWSAEFAVSVLLHSGSLPAEQAGARPSRAGIHRERERVRCNMVCSLRREVFVAQPRFDRERGLVSAARARWCKKIAVENHTHTRVEHCS